MRREERTRQFWRFVLQWLKQLGVRLRHELGQFLCLAAIGCGVACKTLFDAYLAKQPQAFSWTQVLFALIVALMTFPTIYRDWRLFRGSSWIMRFAIGFQAGFFWLTIFGEIRVLPH